MGNSQSYQIKVIGGNPAISRTYVQLGGDGSLWAVGGAIAPSTATANITRATGGTSLTLSNNPGVFVSLNGPSGKQEYKLGTGVPPGQPSGFVGSTGLYGGWQFVDTGYATLLRQSQDALTSRWIAVPQGGNSNNWALWWYSPNSANMQDFSNYVAVDLEVIVPPKPYIV